MTGCQSKQIAGVIWDKTNILKVTNVRGGDNILSLYICLEVVWSAIEEYGEHTEQSYYWFITENIGSIWKYLIKCKYF